MLFQCFLSHYFLGRSGCKNTIPRLPKALGRSFEVPIQMILMIKVVIAMHNHMDRLERTRSFSWILIARGQRKLRKRLHSKRKIPQSKRETENLTNANRVFLKDLRVEFHALVKLLLISFSKVISSWSRPFNIEIS